MMRIIFIILTLTLTSYSNDQIDFDDQIVEGVVEFLKESEEEKKISLKKIFIEKGVYTLDDCIDKNSPNDEIKYTYYIYNPLNKLVVQKSYSDELYSELLAAAEGVEELEWTLLKNNFSVYETTVGYFSLDGTNINTKFDETISIDVKEGLIVHEENYNSTSTINEKKCAIIEARIKLSMEDTYGVKELDDGSVYRGGLKDGLMSGLGIMEDHRVDGFFFGYFENDQPNGKGIFFSNNMLLDGDFVNESYDGNFFILTKDGTFYNGEANEFKRNGWGYFFDPLRDTTIIGNWEEGEIKGEGLNISTDIIYKGEFKDWKPHGKGIHIDLLNEVRMEGTYYLGKPNGNFIVKINDVDYEVIYDNGEIIERIR
tara:strand:- start:1928 stop:3037 length:1110 start_codon:yes stop_codon:yes gene_type:complete